MSWDYLEKSTQTGEQQYTFEYQPLINRLIGRRRNYWTMLRETVYINLKYSILYFLFMSGFKGVSPNSRTSLCLSSAWCRSSAFVLGEQCSVSLVSAVRHRFCKFFFVVVPSYLIFKLIIIVVVRAESRTTDY